MVIQHHLSIWIFKHRDLRFTPLTEEDRQPDTSHGTLMGHFADNLNTIGDLSTPSHTI